MEKRIIINRMNPAEYFACCGVFELVSRASSAVTSRFEGEGNIVDFVLSAEDISVPNLGTVTVEARQFKDKYIAPVVVDGMRLDWWLDVYKEEAGNLKLWAGTCEPVAMLRNYQKLMSNAQLEDMLS